MAMELLTFHNQLIAFFPSDDQDDNFLTFNIIQDTHVACPKLKLGERIGTQLLVAFVGLVGSCSSRD
jgi:hypothetical protein